MNTNLFESPVFVSIGDRLVQEIACLGDAIDFLEDWPVELHDLVYETALKACYEAFSGLRPLHVAERAFTGFAKRAGILEESLAPMPWMTSVKSGGGRVSC